MFARRSALLLSSLLWLSLPSGAWAADPGAPPTARDTVVDDYGGVRVADPYRWLEDAHDPKVREWSEAQDRRARAYLDRLPVRTAIYERLY
ncbi:MAG: S9 family peptidase, partial [Alphaproteobacteria bacterium]|nr:S9 family peptidase [Alphaproteobacteria bacterium]